MMETKIEKETGYAAPYSESSFATVPTPWTMFLRTCLLYQIVRFFVLALKVMRIVVGGHS
ncbi:MAG: hypothetical protein WAR39_02785 [Prevotella sp.]